MDRASFSSHRMRVAETVSTSLERIGRCHAAAAGGFELSAQCRDSIARSRALLARVGSARDPGDRVDPSPGRPAAKA